MMIESYWIFLVFPELTFDSILSYFLIKTNNIKFDNFL